MSDNFQNVAVVDLLTPFANEMEDERLGTFLTLSVGRILCKKNNIESEITSAGLRHITDWLKAAIINNDAWTTNVDSYDRPKKLMKFSDIEQIIKEADKAMLISSQKFSNIKLIEGDEELYEKLHDEYYLVRLLTPAALDKESSEMQHCIGQGSYDSSLNNQDYQFLSLRDPSGKAHATIELKGNRILQLQGKQNKPVVRKYMEYFSNFMRENKLEHNLGVKELGYVIDIDGNWYAPSKMNDGITVKHLNLVGVDDAILPENLTVLEDLRLDGLNYIEKLPKGLKVGGNLMIFKTGISEIPNNIQVGGEFNAMNSMLKEFPSGFKIGTNLNLSQTLITHISEPIIISGNATLSHMNITEIPAGSKIKGWLDIGNTEIKELPRDLEVGSDLFLVNTPIRTIPLGVKISGNLDLSHTNVDTIEDGVVIGGTLYVFEDSKMTYLPSNLHVHGLDVSRSNIVHLNNGLTVDENCILSYSAITDLPKNMKVGKGLYIGNTQISELPDDIQVGDLISMNEGQLTSLPDTISDEVQIHYADKRVLMKVSDFRKLHETLKI